MNRRSSHVDDRNYIREAQEMLNGLSLSDLYKMLEIVVEQQEQFASPERRKELAAVEDVIKNMSHLEQGRIERILRGQSEMARGAKPTDGNTKKYHKKV